MIMTRRMNLAVVLAGLLVFAQTASSHAGLRHFWGSPCGSSGGSNCSSGMMGWQAPMQDACMMVPAGEHQGYVPMAGQGMLMPPQNGSSVMGMINGNGQSTDQLADFDGVPGTLGLTYQRPTKRIPADKHSRIGLIEICVSQSTFRSLEPGEEIKITVEDKAAHFKELEGYFGDDDKWHFESKPLYPGIPHIYDANFEVVKTEMKRERKNEKFVEWEVEAKVRDLGIRRMRLIPGRTVFMQFP